MTSATAALSSAGPVFDDFADAIIVTERRQVEVTFRAFLETVPDAVVIVNDGGRIVLVNSQTERLFGYPSSGLIGQPAELLIPERFRQHHPEYRGGHFHEARTRTTGSETDLCGRRKDGSEFPIEITLSPLKTEEGIFVSSTIRDISDRKATETALELANRELETFSYSVAHDLRAPLRGMTSFAQILLDEYRDKLDDFAVDSLQEIHQNAVRMGALIDALLSLSRVTRSDVKPELVNLARLAGEIAVDLKATDPARDVDFAMADRLEARMDPQLARTLMENLLGNAWKFTGKVKSARIEFAVTEQRGRCVFFVRDNGTGFDMAHADKLFIAFQRLHSIGEFPGTGVGLATAQRIVARHGGRIWADGTVNGGATFYFTIAGTVAAATP
jgi:PAS domain S-box-containing protein